MYRRIEFLRQPLAERRLEDSTYMVITYEAFYIYGHTIASSWISEIVIQPPFSI